jgi:hypothetical protein
MKVKVGLYGQMVICHFHRLQVRVNNKAILFSSGRCW